MSNPFAPPLPSFNTAESPWPSPAQPLQASMPPTAAPPSAPQFTSLPQAPSFRPPMLPQQQPRNVMQQIMPLLIAAAAGGKDLAAMGTGLTAYLQGRRMRDRERTDARLQQQKEEAERAEFYARALQNAGQFDDPVDFEQWRTAIAPLAQHYNVPVESFTFNNKKLAEKTRKEAAQLLASLDKQHPDGNYTADWNGKRVTRAELAKLAGQAAFDAQGQPLAPTTKASGEPFTLGEGQTRFDASGKPIASGAPKPSPRPVSVPKGGVLVDPATGAVIARGPADTGGAKADASDLVQAVIDNPALWDNLTPTARTKIAPELSKRGFAGFGKPLEATAIAKIAETKAAIESLKDLRTTLKENEQYIGPVAGLQALNPYSTAREAQSKIDLVRQRVGKALEGGVLRKEDEEKYKRILATLRDEPSTAIYKIDNLIQTLERDMAAFEAEQKTAGRRMPAAGGGGKADPLGIRGGGQ